MDETGKVGRAGERQPLDRASVGARDRREGPPFVHDQGRTSLVRGRPRHREGQQESDDDADSQSPLHIEQDAGRPVDVNSRAIAEQWQ